MPGHAASDMMGCPLFLSSHFTVQSSLNMPILVLSYKSKERTVRDIIQQASKVSTKEAKTWMRTKDVKIACANAENVFSNEDTETLVFKEKENYEK